ncbi:MAG TPA: LON peptidase substrate-binding domain-containing protein [Anaerolineaceae bacterium]|nr:LON peptidase substrate-binding domain-containing protein [Anaerolineaceae bacterium]
MRTIPLFPLNTVLFPGMPLELHIFEPRYRQMIKRCLDEQVPFGVVMIRSGLEANGPLAEVFSIGCTAEIAHVDPLADGRMNLLVVGTERFEILALDDTLPYLVGQVEARPLGHHHILAVLRGARRLPALMRTHLRGLTNPEAVDLDQAQLDFPHDPLAQMYLAAALLQLPAIEKQVLLEAPGAPELLDSLLRLYRRENALQQILKPPASLGAAQQAWLN